MIRPQLSTVSRVGVAAVAATALVACGSSRQDSTGTAAAGSCDPGMTDTSITLGQSSVQSGAGAAYKPLATVPAAYFEELNADGGVTFGDGKKRTVKFVSLDDNYDPARAAINVRRLVEQDQVFALFENTGTAAILATADYAQQHSVPLLFSGSGSDELAAEYAAGTAPIYLSGLPSVANENRIFIDAIKADNPSASLAILYPNDGLGKGQLGNIHKYVEGTGLTVVGEESYELTAPTVDSQVTKLRESGADVFLHLGTGAFVTGALKKLNELGWHPQKWVISSSVDASAIIRPAGEGAGQNLHSAYWLYGVAEGENPDVEGVQQWREWAQAHGQEDTSTVGVQAYHQVQLLQQVLENTKGCTRADLIAAAKDTQGMKSSVSLPGLTFGMVGDDPSSVSSLALIRWEDNHWVYGDVVRTDG